MGKIQSKTILKKISKILILTSFLLITEDTYARNPLGALREAARALRIGTSRRMSTLPPVARISPVPAPSSGPHEPPAALPSPQLPAPSANLELGPTGTDAPSAVSVPSQALPHATPPSPLPGSTESSGFGTLTRHLRSRWGLAGNPHPDGESPQHTPERRTSHSMPAASHPSSHAPNQAKGTHSGRVEALLRSKPKKPSITTPVADDPQVIEKIQELMTDYHPSDESIEDPIIHGKIREKLYYLRSATQDGSPRTSADPLSQQGLIAAAALRSASKKGLSIEGAIRSVHPKMKGKITDEQHEEATQAFFVKKAKLTLSQIELMNRLGITPSDTEGLRTLSFQKMKDILTSQENCYTVSYGESALKDGDIVEGSIEHRENGIGHYDIDCANNPVFEPFRYLIQQFQKTPDLTSHDKMNLLSTFLKMGLKAPEYSCPSLRAVQGISRDLGRLSIAEYAQVGTADCRPHSMILACLAGLAGIEAKYANIQLEHSGEGQKPTQEPHSVVKYWDETGKVYIADSYFTQLNGIAFAELEKGLKLKETGIFARIIQQNPFPIILRAPTAEGLADCTAALQSAGEASQRPAAAISHRKEPALPSATPPHTPSRAKGSSHLPLTNGVSAHPALPQ